MLMFASFTHFSSTARPATAERKWRTEWTICMSIQRSLNSLIALLLFMASTLCVIESTPADAASLSSTEPVLIAQSDDEKKPKPEDAEDDLGEDDC